MKTLVFVKQVPEAESVKLDPATGNLVRDGAAGRMNPNDENVVQAALELKEKYGGTITAISMGPPQAAQVLKTALAMGCDQACLLSDRAFGGADTLATSYTLAKAAEKIGDFDLLLFGRSASDGDTAQTGPATAAWLDIPQLCLASSIEIEDGRALCLREREDKIERLSVALPALITVPLGLNRPRYPSVMDIMRAGRKPISIWTAADLKAEPDRIGTAGSPSVTKRVFEPERRRKDTRFFEGSADDIARQIAELLAEKHII